MALPHVLHTASEVATLRHQLSEQGRTVALVPTMGALHAGHLALVDRARELADVVIVSIFVNPLQFGAGEDFDRYPRTLDADVAALAGKADFVFAPDVNEVYPERIGGEPVPAKHAGVVGENFEGASRPGHFDGVLTVVARLFDIVKPEVVVFGQKDAQQVFLIRNMIHQDGLPIRFEVIETIREVDGLALSSRNRYLSEEERAAALALPHALLAVARHALHSPAGELREVGREVFEQYPLVRLDYLDIVDPTTFQPVSNDYQGPATVVVAAVVGTTRLIDTENLERLHA
ncbi:pantoate--beta-alanine ligase [Aurantimicrobium minutum]|uniref:pantoate--beta-alanine ligase n=1 Tax=Aurantimicrobium minutum TaxID=708131 RepID=UPI0024745135|nr:pantoate--beta-alanine ligase [Aurantimicrobium minutum]MDH6423576.1 pantoate--beta-alanine ligase [Aurantimicrobium minutum]